MLRNMTEFAPNGTQIKTPGGFSFDPADVSAVEAHGNEMERPRLIVFTKGGGFTTITFHRNVDGGPPDIYGMKRNIEAATR